MLKLELTPFLTLSNNLSTAILWWLFDKNNRICHDIFSAMIRKGERSFVRTHKIVERQKQQIVTDPRRAGPFEKRFMFPHFMQKSRSLWGKNNNVNSDSWQPRLSKKAMSKVDLFRVWQPKSVYIIVKQIFWQTRKTHSIILRPRVPNPELACQSYPRHFLSEE